MVDSMAVDSIHSSLLDVFLITFVKGKDSSPSTSNGPLLATSVQVARHLVAINMHENV